MAQLPSRRIWIPLAVLVVAGGALAYWQYDRRLPKRFAPVVEGRLYRSGKLEAAQLERLVRGYGIHTVISLLNPQAPESVAERQAAERLGIRWQNVPLPGNGASTPAERERLKALLFDDQAGPMLVHCAAGANRTGLAVGMYRLHQQGWTLEQVLEEMRRFGFEDEPQHQALREALALEAAAAATSSAPAPLPP